MGTKSCLPSAVGHWCVELTEVRDGRRCAVSVIRNHQMLLARALPAGCSHDEQIRARWRGQKRKRSTSECEGDMQPRLKALLHVDASACAGERRRAV